MAEWLFEAGIGENRAALVENDQIMAMRIERQDHKLRVGDIYPARLGAPLPSGGAQLRLIGTNETATLDQRPKSVSEGTELMVEIIREAIPERANPKPARARLAPEGATTIAGPDLRSQLYATVFPVQDITPLSAAMPGEDRLEAVGWSERLQQAEMGLMPFAGGLLRLSITPAMALIDIDGHLPPLALCKAGALAAAHMIRLFDLGGPIGLDLPVPPHAGKGERQEAVLAFDTALPQPFERTAVNGYGFMQIIRPRPRASIPELLAADRNLTMALALLRQARRSQGFGARTICAHPAVLQHFELHPEWIATLSRELGVAISLQPDTTLVMPSPITGSGYVHVEQV